MRIIPVYNTVVLPEVQYNLEPDILTDAEKNSFHQNDEILIVPIKEFKTRENLRPEDFYKIGLHGTIKEIRSNGQNFGLAVNTDKRIEIISPLVTDSEISADFIYLEDDKDMTDAEITATFNIVLNMLGEIASHFQWGNWAMNFTERLDNINEVVSIVAPYADLTPDERYALLETDSLRKRSDLIIGIMMKYRDMVNIQADISKKIQDEQGDQYRENLIKREITLLNDELNEMNPDSASDIDMFEKKIAEADFPEEVAKEVNRVFRHFKQGGEDDHEYGANYEYLDFMTSLSFKTPDMPEVDLNKAKEILDRDHYGLKKVKERVLQHIAVMIMKDKKTKTGIENKAKESDAGENKDSNKSASTGSIILFVGAPGTGKTSMGKSIAEALGRKYVRISLGGIRDEAEIRGHRRTYIGAMPGRIMDAIKRSGVNNPVMVLDEIDKLESNGYNGDPAAALLEVLDPEQNNTFTDHYVNAPYDLSNVVFICTANSLETIPGPLLDRMEVIELPGYTAKDKFYIAKEHLLAKSIEEAGLEKKNISISDSVLKNIVANYTMEAGVRGLKKRLDQIMRQAAVKMLSDHTDKVTVKVTDLPKLLGTKTALHDKVLKKNIPGVVTGLAWTEAGGEILFIETTAMHGSGQLIITGQLGDVMKESATIALSLVKSMFYDKKYKFDDKDIHIHVPSGAVPKDGPSAGVTLVTALTSLVLGQSVSPYLAMTGEISLRGQVLPIGGLPEKLMAAERARVKKVLIPTSNKEDLIDVPEDTKKNLEIVPVENINDVLHEALGIRVPRQDRKFFANDGKEEKEPAAEIEDKPVIPAVPGRKISKIDIPSQSY